MTHSPNPQNDLESPPNHPVPPPRRRRKILLAIGIFILIGVGGGVGYAWYFIQRQLAPLIERNLTQLLSRPVELGQVQGFSLNSIQFGESAIPATPTDPDQATTEAVSVFFDPIALLTRRTLELDVTLINPDVYLEQDEERQWISTRISPQEGKGPITTKLQIIRISNADVILAPRSPQGQRQPTVAAVVETGSVSFLDDLVQYRVIGALATSGVFQVRGETITETLDTNLVVSGSDVQADEVERLVGLPLDLQAGQVGGNLEIELRREQPPLIQGVATLDSVTLDLPQLPQPFTNSNGQLLFKGTEIELDKVATEFGQIPLIAEGIVDTQEGYNLLARTATVDVKQVLKTLEIKENELPVPVSGELLAAFRVTGALDEPAVAAKIVTTKPVQVDQLIFQQISAELALVDTTLQITQFQAKPVVGGLITAEGRVNLAGETQTVALEVNASNLPANAIARLYNLDLPAPLGPVSAQAQIAGPLGNLENLQVTATANLGLAGGIARLTNFSVTDQRWRGLVAFSGVEPSLLVEDVPPLLQGQPIQGQFAIAGSLETFAPESISLTGTANINVAGGQLIAQQIQLQQGRWQALVRASGIQLSRLADVPPALQGSVNGSFRLLGNVNQPGLPAITGVGSLVANVAGGVLDFTNVQLQQGQLRAQVQARGIQARQIAPQLANTLDSPISGNLILTTNLENFSLNTINVQGQLQMAVDGGTVTATNLQVNEGNWQALVLANQVPVNDFAPQLPPTARGLLTGSVIVGGAFAPFSINTVRGVDAATIRVAGGTVTATNLQLLNGNWQATVEANNIAVARIAPQLPQQFQGILSTDTFQVAGSFQPFSLNQVTGLDAARIQVAGGSVVASNLQLLNGNWQATLVANNLAAGQLLPQLPERFDGTLSTDEFQIAGSFNPFAFNRITGLDAATLQLAGGSLTARELQLLNGNWQATLEASNLAVGQLLPQLPDRFDGTLSTDEFQIAGSFNPFSFNQITGLDAARLQLAGGSLTASNLQLLNGNWQATLEASNLAVGQLLPQLPDRFDGTLSTDAFRVAGNLQPFSFDRVIGLDSAILQVAGGNVTASNLQLFDGNFQATLEANNLAVGQLFPQFPDRFAGTLSTDTFQILGSLQPFSLNRVTGLDAAILQLAGGNVTASNLQLFDGNFQATLEANNLAVGQLFPQFPDRFDGILSTDNFQVSGSLQPFSLNRITGIDTARLQLAGGTITARELQLFDNNWQGILEASNVAISQLAPQLPPEISGTLTTNAFSVSGSLQPFSISSISGLEAARLEVAGGTVNLNNVQVVNGNIQAAIAFDQVQLSQLAPQLPDSLQSPVTGNFQLTGNLQNLSLNAIQGIGNVALTVDGGRVQLENLRLANGNFTATVDANQVPVGELAPQLPPQFAGLLTGNFQVAGDLDNLTLDAIRVLGGQGQLAIAGGTIQARNVQLANQRFRANLAPTNVNIGQLFEQFEGEVTGDVAVNANLQNLTPAGIQAQGQLTFSEGLPSLPGPLQTAFSWTGQRLQIQQATAPGFDVSGVVDVNLARQGAEALQRFNLNVNAQGLNLAELPFELPGPFAGFNPTGLLDFQGTIAGTPTQPDVQGQLALRNFTIDGLQLDPVLTGNVNFAPGEGLNLQLAGEDNQIQIALGPNNQIQTLLVRTDGALITGRQQGNLLLVEAESFPIGLIDNFVSLPPAIANQPLSGELSGELAVNPRTFEASGEILVNNPVFGRLSGDILTADFTYANGQFLLDQARFVVGESEYLAQGQFVPTPQGPRFQAQVQLAQARIEDTLLALQVFDLTDLTQPNVPITGRAENLNALSVGLVDSPLLSQLRRLSEVEAYLAQQQQQREEATPLPPIAELEGSITGTINVVGSPSEGIEAAFNIQGQQWDWGPYDINQVLAEGTFQDGVLTLVPLRFELADGLLAFSGTVGGETQTGQLRLESVPVSLIQEFIDLPPGFGINGEISALATLAGSQANPQAIGELVLYDATINQTPIPALETSFRYNNARLNFFATGLFAEDDPLAIRGSIPVQLPFATVAPENNELSLQVNLRNNALALLDVLTRQQVNWIEGQGNVELDIAGTINPDTGRPTNLIAEGIATVEGATIGLEALPEESLTNVAGNILFNFDEIEVQQLRGDFSGGQLVAAGTIPINTPQPQENPLTVQLDQLALNLKGLYQGGVRGNVVVTGTALEPELGGNIDLFDGRILIAEAARGDTGLAGETEGGFRESVGFNDLRLTLAEDVQVTQPPLLNFLAAGDLSLGGTLADIRPEGIIRLKRGQVNLFTTQFRLAGGYEQTAQFFPERGLNPYLDVRLVASVAEATRSPILADPLTPEVSDIPVTDFGTVQTVRIQARVEGFATELTENLELTSNPPRSETEIVSLLGGGFVETLGRGDTTLGLANLAGSALLGSVQNIIGDALGLSEFRLYPTVVTDDEARRSTLGLAAEASVDVTDRVSASIQKSLTTDEPVRVGVRYRLSDEIMLRGSVDPTGEGRAIVEYESRF